TVISDNTTYANTRAGIVVGLGAVALDNQSYGQAAGSGIDLLGGEARGNVVFDNFSGIVGAGVYASNRVFHNLDAGISADGGSTVSGNQVYSNAYGIQTIVSGSYAPSYLNNNLVYANTNYGIG